MSAASLYVKPPLTWRSRKRVTRAKALPYDVPVRASIGEGTAVKQIIDQIGRLSHDQRLELLEALEAAIAEEIAARSGECPSACPRCGCPDAVGKGRDPDGAPRRLCRGCGRTFSSKTRSLLSRSKLPAAAWMEFAACMADGLALRETAARCGTSLYTAWFMRMRVCEVMSRRLAACREGSFHVDDTHFVVSLSGNHARAAWFDMPRKPHRNGRDGRRAGGSRTANRVAVSCGINEYGDCFCELAAQGAPSAVEEGLVLSDRIPAGSRILSDGDLSCKSALEGRDHAVAGRFGINRVNALHSRLKGFVAPFHGVSTRRLQRYLDWFCYLEQFKASDVDRRELLFSHEARGRYFGTRVLTHLELRPFESYWDRRRYAEWTRHMSMVV